MPVIALVNNAEKGIREFAAPIEKIISEMGYIPDFIEYSDCLSYDFSTVDGIQHAAWLLGRQSFARRSGNGHPHFRRDFEMAHSVMATQTALAQRVATHCGTYRVSQRRIELDQSQ